MAPASHQPESGARGGRRSSSRPTDPPNAQQVSRGIQSVIERVTRSGDLIVDLQPTPSRFAILMASGRRVVCCFAISSGDAQTQDTDELTINALPHARGRVRTVRHGHLSRILAANPGRAAAIALDHPARWREDPDELALACYMALQPGGHLVTAVHPWLPAKRTVRTTPWQSAGLIYRGQHPIAERPPHHVPVHAFVKPPLEAMSSRNGR
jgi:hypothetical protein